MDDARATHILGLVQQGRNGLRVHPFGWDRSWNVTIFVQCVEDEVEFSIWTTSPEVDPYAYLISGNHSRLADCIAPLMRKLAGLPGIGTNFLISPACLELIAEIAAAAQPTTYREAIAIDFRHVDADRVMEA